MKTELKSTEVLSLLKNQSSNFAWLDVRSEGEFEEGSIPGFMSCPILNNAERAQVGTTYKKEGQQKAIELGHYLVKESKNIRIDSWVAQIHKSHLNTAVVCCWRGGLRSKTACDWLNERGFKTVRVEGGYKSLRNDLLGQLQQLPNFIVLSGLTGSGKTKLIHEFKDTAVDLEQHAHHRGSTFGMHIRGVQPKQATFENKIFFDLLSNQPLLLIEDESIRIGQVQIPLPVKNKMIQSPVIWIDSSMSERIESIAKEYVVDLVLQGFDPEEIYKKLEYSLLLLKKKLGSSLTTELIKELKISFNSNLLLPQTHAKWIEPLLSAHYDKLYNYSFNRKPRSIIFKGNKEECKQWIQKKFDSLKQ